ncbi:MAG: hypothetical protein IIC09_00640 [Proteobacteria bacterium]|nr:hypothetical protein [Pseudomonadota bacterium]
MPLEELNFPAGSHLLAGWQAKDAQAISSEYVEAIKTVARSIANNGYDIRVPPWPGTVYFEDISSESSFDLIEIIVDTSLKQGTL